MAKPRRPRNSSQPRRSRALLIVVGLTALAGGGYFYGAPVASDARAATAYSARVACSCRFIAGRDLSDCNKDKMPGMEWVRLSEDVDARSVTARIPLMASDTASLREGYGCVLQPWQQQD